MLDHNHKQVTRIAYPASLQRHLRQMHDVRQDDMENLDSDDLGRMHESNHARQLEPLPQDMRGERQDCPGCGQPHDVAFHYCPDCGRRMYSTSAVGIAPTMPTAADLAEASDLCRRIHQGAFDRFLEDLLEATHGRKRARREMRRGR